MAMHARYRAADPRSESDTGATGLKATAIAANVAPHRYLRMLSASTRTTIDPAQTAKEANNTVVSLPSVHSNPSSKHSAARAAHLTVLVITETSEAFGNPVATKGRELQMG